MINNINVLNPSDSLSNRNSPSSVNHSVSHPQVKGKPSSLTIFSKPKSMNSSCELKTQDDTMSHKFNALKLEQKKKFLIQKNKHTFINNINEGGVESSSGKNGSRKNSEEGEEEKLSSSEEKSGEVLRTIITNFMRDIDTLNDNKSSLIMKSESDLSVHQGIINMKNTKPENIKSEENEHNVKKNPEGGKKEKKKATIIDPRSSEKVPLRNQRRSVSHVVTPSNKLSGVQLASQYVSPVQRINKKSKNYNGIFHSIAVLLHISRFIRNIKIKSGHIGHLGTVQAKMVNDLCNDVQTEAEGEINNPNFAAQTDNLILRMIKKFNQEEEEMKAGKKKKIVFAMKNYVQKKFRVSLGFLSSSIKVINPENRTKFTWDFLIVTLNILELLVVPVELGFIISKEATFVIYYTWLRYILYSCLFLDIVLNFNTSYYEKGALIMTRPEIAGHYLKSSFFIHVLSVSPFIIQLAITDKNQIFSEEKSIIDFFKLVFLLRYNSVLRIFQRISERYNVSDYTNNIISLLKLGILLFYISHFCACLWHYIALYDSSLYQKTWLTEMRAICGCSELFYDEYITSLYWAVTTMITIGYGDIVPLTPNEKLFTIISMLVACCMFAYILNGIGLIVISLNKRKALLRHKIIAVNQYLDMKNIDNDLRLRIRKYLEYIYEERNTLIREGQSVITLLSSSLRTEFYQRANVEVLSGIPCFYYFNMKILKPLALIMKEISFTPEDTIIKDREVDNQELFFILEGDVRIFLNHSENENSGFRKETNLKKLKKGEFFGEISFFSGQPRSASAKSFDFSNLIVVSREDFLGLLRNFPVELEKFCYIRDSITLYKNYYSLDTRCFCCNQFNHIAAECPMTHVCINPERVIREYTASTPQQRTNFQRRIYSGINVRYNARANYRTTHFAAIRIQKSRILEKYFLKFRSESEEEHLTEEKEEIEEREIEFSTHRLNSHRETIQSATKISKKHNKTSFVIPRERLKTHVVNFQRSSDIFENQSPSLLERNLPSPINRNTNFFFDSEMTFTNGRSHTQKTVTMGSQKKKSNPIEEDVKSRKSIHKRSTKRSLAMSETTPTLAAGAKHSFGEERGLFTQISHLFSKHQVEDFDRLKEYEYYFPHNNLEEVIRLIKKLAKLKNRERDLLKHKSIQRLNTNKSFKVLKEQATLKQKKKDDNLGSKKLGSTSPTHHRKKAPKSTPTLLQKKWSQEKYFNSEHNHKHAIYLFCLIRKYSAHCLVCRIKRWFSGKKRMNTFTDHTK